MKNNKKVQPELLIKWLQKLEKDAGFPISINLLVSGGSVEFVSMEAAENEHRKLFDCDVEWGDNMPSPSITKLGLRGGYFG